MPLRLHPDVITTDTDDGTVLLHGRTGRYWQLNTTGTTVLRQLLEGDEPDHIAAALAQRYGITARQAEHDVTTVVGQLRTAELVIAI